jgi:hypothetical protein
MRHIREAIESGTLVQPFRASDVNRALGIDYGGVFLPKHRVGNPGGFTQHFIQIERGLISLEIAEAETGIGSCGQSKNRENPC